MKLYQDRKIVLLTKHDKARAIKPLLESETGCELFVEQRFDTDKLGTFSREIKRAKSQLESARIKIKKGIKYSGAEIGIATEGSFGSHPYAPIPWHVELVLLYDKKEHFEIFGVYEGPDTNYAHTCVRSFEEVQGFAEKMGFPEHYLILRPDHSEHKWIIKDIDNYEKLYDAFLSCLRLSKTGCCFVETDMRAHANPTRMKNIQKATENLISKLLNFCPKCSAPGFSIKDVVKGLPCEWCGLPGEGILKHVYSCYKCKYTSEILYPYGRTSPAKYCHTCNP